MATPISSRPTQKRFLGNSSPSKMEVHDLTNEKTRCQIDEIIAARHAVVFTPDTLAQAQTEGYDNGAHCLGGSRR